MLPRTYDAEVRDHVAIVDKNNDRFHMLFASREALKENPFRPHWVRECGDERTLDAMERWFAARRDRWQEWGELAEQIGIDAFWTHMEALLEAEPIEVVVATTMSPLDDPLEIGLGEMLAGTREHRTETLYVHRFPSAEARSRFLDWFYADGNFHLAHRSSPSHGTPERMNSDASSTTSRQGRSPWRARLREDAGEAAPTVSGNTLNLAASANTLALAAYTLTLTGR